ncbi:neural cell adhesion molecule 1-like isoform X2 [Tubulanus polymorphus]|uniref:neural cell adhesion molecule 1-like isoform X2 n=1 Tax=Tubulanus polymorphus TaxID=672921 RepID=UPI003DA204FC
MSRCRTNVGTMENVIALVIIVSSIASGIKAGRPTIHVRGDSVTEGNRATLTCTVTSDKRYKTSWEWKQKTTDLLYKRASVEGTYHKNKAVLKLIFTEAARNESGVYYCLVRSENLHYYGIAKLDVFYPPEYVGSYDVTSAPIGESMVSIKCSFKGNPVPVIAWSKGDETIRDYSIKYNSVPDTSRSELLIDTDLKSYGTYVCTGLNVAGSLPIQRKLIQVYTPARPYDLAIERKSDSMLKVMISPPVDFVGKPIIDVQVAWKKESEPLFNIFRANLRIWKERDVVYAYIDGLEPNTNYVIRARARNAIGFGQWTYKHVLTLNRTMVYAGPDSAGRLLQSNKASETEAPPGEGTKTTVIVTVSTIAVSCSIGLCVLTAILMKIEKRKKHHPPPLNVDSAVAETLFTTEIE